MGFLRGAFDFALKVIALQKMCLRSNSQLLYPFLSLLSEIGSVLEITISSYKQIYHSNNCLSLSFRRFLCEYITGFRHGLH